MKKKKQTSQQVQKHHLENYQNLYNLVIIDGIIDFYFCKRIQIF